MSSIHITRLSRLSPNRLVKKMGKARSTELATPHFDANCLLAFPNSIPDIPNKEKKGVGVENSLSTCKRKKRISFWKRGALEADFAVLEHLAKLERNRGSNSSSQKFKKGDKGKFTKF